MARARILQPGELEETRGAIEEYRLPESTLFAYREQRCRRLAREGNVLAVYLDFVACLAAAQHEGLMKTPLLPATGLEGAWLQNPSLVWASLRRLGKAAANLVAEQERDYFSSLPEREEPWFLVQAEALLAGRLPDVMPATAPLTAAALQLEWTRYVLEQAQAPPPRYQEAEVCPLCGGQPVAGVILAAGNARGLRYLHCGLCGSSWHVVRSKCSHCGEGRDLGYFTLQGEMEHVRAEACGDCHSYIKVMYQQEEPELEPLADDLATLALDLRMAEEGYVRSGMNPLFLPGPVTSP